MAKKGLDGIDLKRRGGGVSLVSAVRESSSHGLRTVRVGEVSPNPANPEWRSAGEGDDFEQLLASVTSMGVLQPLLLVPASAWRAANPDESLPLEDAAWVAMDGNRRLIAARQSGTTEVPAFVRDDLAGESDAILLHANGGRAELTPIDQAVAYRRLLDNGFTQAKLATELGVSQGTISKRIALLKLPAPFQDAVGAGQIPVNDAFEAASEPPEVLKAAVACFAESPSWGIGQAIHNGRNALRRAESDRRTAELAEELAAPILTGNPWDKRPAMRQVNDQKTIKAAAKEGSLMLHAGWDGPEYYVHEPASPRNLTAETQDRNARKARWPFVVELAGQQPQAAAFRALVVRHYVQQALDWDIGLKLIHELGISTADSRWALEAEADDKNAEKVAWCLIVGSWERGVRGDHVGWGDRQAGFYDRLVALGYQVGEWEQEKLTTGRAS